MRATSIVLLIVIALLAAISVEAACPDPTNQVCANGCGKQIRDDTWFGNCDWQPCQLVYSQPVDDSFVPIPDQCIDGSYYDFYCDANDPYNHNNTIITDADGDGYDIQCDMDCDDSNSSVHPGAPELCFDNGIDENCDTQVNEGCSCLIGDNQSCGADLKGVCVGAVTICAGGSWPTCDTAIYTAHNASYEAIETSCDGLDNDCDGQTDEDGACCVDLDGDGYGESCAPGPDCNDNNASINPGADEVCNFIDDNCNLIADEGFDADGDAFSVCKNDCNDTDASVNPIASEICEDGIDQNCDGSDPLCSCIDTDGDSYYVYDALTCPSGNDCNDSDFTIKPGNTETCDGLDNDCDGNIDEGAYQCESDSDCNDDECYAGTYRDYYCQNPSTCSSSCQYTETDDSCTSGSSTPTGSAPSCLITSPNSGSVFKAGKTISFVEHYGDADVYRWNFGDGMISSSQNPVYAYASTGPKTVSVYKANSGGTAECSVSIDIVECLLNSDCAGLCCGDSCFEPCSAGSCGDDFIEDGMLYSQSCENPDSCSSLCVNVEVCSVACGSDLDCDDSSGLTIDSCEAPDTCDAACINSPKEIDIDIISPQERDYVNDNILLQYTTNYDVECFYELNGGNREQLQSNSFTIDARNGGNTLTIYCLDSYATVDFTVVSEEDQIGDLVDPNDENLMDDLLAGDEIVLGEQDVIDIIEDVIVLEKFELRKRLKVKDGISNITMTVKNPKPFTEYNITVRQTIPKAAAESASLITSPLPFTIIEADPVIEFTIEQLAPNEQAELVYFIQGTLDEDLLQQIVDKISADEVTQEQMDEAMGHQEATEKAVKVTQKVDTGDGKTKIVTKFNPKKSLKGVNLYLKIPKCAAEHISELKFKNGNYKVIADDPLIMWHFDEAEEEIILSYELEKELSPECLAELKAMIIAQDVGDDLLSKIPLFTIILPFLLIPVIAGTVIFFTRFEVSTDKALPQPVNVPKAEAAEPVFEMLPEPKIEIPGITPKELAIEEEAFEIPAITPKEMTSEESAFEIASQLGSIRTKDLYKPTKKHRHMEHMDGYL